MSPAEHAELRALLAIRWLSACVAFDTICRASGKPIDAGTAQRLDAEIRKIAFDDEHVERDDLEVLRLAYNRATAAGVSRAECAAAVALARAKGGHHG